MNQERRWEQVARDRLRMIERLVARIEETNREYVSALARPYGSADPQGALARAASVAAEARTAIIAPAQLAGE